MGFSGLMSRSVSDFGKSASRQGRAVSRVIVHHWAGVAGGDARLLNPNEEVSANYILYSDGTLVGQVDESRRAWTSGSFDVDAESITIEIQNTGGAAPGRSDSDPESWPVSAAAFSKLVQLVADVARRYGWGGVSASRVRGHREFASTACPGGYLWARLGDVRSQADALVRGGGAVAPGIKGGTKVKAHHHVEDHKARNGGRSIVPGEGVWLHDNPKAGAANAKNLVGAGGYYSFVEHVYAEGTPGDVLELFLMWQTNPGKKDESNSPHYTATVEIGASGKVKAHLPFLRYVGVKGKAVAVYARLNAPKSNKKTVKVTCFDSDAYLFESA